MIKDNKGKKEYLIAKAPHLAVLLQELLIQKKKHIYIAKQVVNYLLPLVITFSIHMLKVKSELGELLFIGLTQLNEKPIAWDLQLSKIQI